MASFFYVTPAFTRLCPQVLVVVHIFEEVLNLKRRDIKITKTLNQAYKTHISSLKLHNKILVSCIYK